MSATRPSQDLRRLVLLSAHSDTSRTVSLLRSNTHSFALKCVGSRCGPIVLREFLAGHHPAVINGELLAVPRALTEIEDGDMPALTAHEHGLVGVRNHKSRQV